MTPQEFLAKYCLPSAMPTPRVLEFTEDLHAMVEHVRAEEHREACIARDALHSLYGATIAKLEVEIRGLKKGGSNDLRVDLAEAKHELSKHSPDGCVGASVYSALLRDRDIVNERLSKSLARDTELCALLDEAHRRITELEDSAPAPSEAAKPQSGMWLCSGCGERWAPNTLDSGWRATPEGPQHKCPGNHPQHGHEPARFFPDEPQPPAAWTAEEIAAAKERAKKFDSCFTYQPPAGEVCCTCGGFKRLRCDDHECGCSGYSCPSCAKGGE
jgi:hypothetical protein